MFDSCVQTNEKLHRFDAIVEVKQNKKKTLRRKKESKQTIESHTHRRLQAVLCATGTLHILSDNESFIIFATVDV